MISPFGTRLFVKLIRSLKPLVSGLNEKTTASAATTPASLFHA